MAWKRWRIEDVIHYPGTQEVEKYVYTPGIHWLEAAKALREGGILGMKCPDGSVYVPPKTYCPDGSPGELVEIQGPWRVLTFTVIYEDLYGEKLPEPQVIALVRPDDASGGGLVHILKADPSKIYIGMEVKPHWKPADKRTGHITDIEYFEPA
jgi:uncharacterized OB-fold protein